MRLRPLVFCLLGLFALISPMLLTGCAADSVALHRYMLPRADGAAAIASADRPALLVPRPRLSGLIDRRGLLMQVDEIQIHEASGHQWAEDLASQLQQQLSRALAERSQHWGIVQHDKANQPARLLVYVQQFQGRYDGQAIISGHWQLIGPTGDILVEQNYWLSQALEEAGYPALVHSLNQAWMQLAEKIVQQLDHSLAPSLPLVGSQPAPDNPQ